MIRLRENLEVLRVEMNEEELQAYLDGMQEAGFEVKFTSKEALESFEDSLGLLVDYEQMTVEYATWYSLEDNYEIVSKRLNNK